MANCFILHLYMKTRFLFFIVLFISLKTTFAQQVGSWRLHFRYAISEDVAYSDDKILSSTGESILLYNPNNGEVRELDKSNSLSDIGIKKLAYCADLQTFIIAYNSTNLDLLTNDLTLTNIPDIKNKVSAGSKNINNIFIDKTLAYISSDLGIIVLDVANQEIDETYIIGNAGNNVPILDIAIQNDTIYAITETEGIKFAPLNGVNLLDFNNWQSLLNAPAGTPNFIELFNNELYLVSNKNALRKKTAAGWEDVFVNTSSKFLSLTASEKLVAIFDLDSSGTALKKRILSVGVSSIDTIEDKEGLDALLGVYINSNDLYIGDYAFGLINFNTRKRIEPNGKPFGNNAYSFNSLKNKVFTASGSVTSNLDAEYNTSGFYYFQDNGWINVNRFSHPEINEILNFLDVKESPFDNKVYCATTTGMVVYDYQNFELYDTANSNIKQHYAGNDSRYITGLDFDAQGNVWMVNSQTNLPLLVFTRQGEWYSYPLSFGANLKYNHILVDKNSQKWVTLKGKGLSVFPSIEEFVGNYGNAAISLTIGSANLPNDNVNCIAEDKNGSIWAGTDQGIAVFDCPERVFDNTSDCMVSRRIKSTLDQYTEYLFDTDKVNTITIDGANRKWVGTNSGAYLLSESGDEVLLSFNTENSPMPSNEVLTIGIQEESGEVFIGTSLGMASYFGDATTPSEDISNIKAFPNPIRPDYFGTISVTGLVENTFIKITDINGTLVKEGDALGGKFVWDGKDYNGKRVKTGVYLVFSSDNKSKNKAVAKLVFIN